MQGTGLRPGSHAGLFVIAFLAAACGAGRTPLAPAADSTAETTPSGGNGGNRGSSAGGAGVGTAGGGEAGRAASGTGSLVEPRQTDGGTDVVWINSQGDCVLSTSIPDPTTAVGCRLIYDDQLALPCSQYRAVRTGSCGDYLVLAGSADESMFMCYYDASTRRLAAARNCSDIQQYCDSQAWCRWMGPDVGGCYVQDPRNLPTQICPPDAAPCPGTGGPAMVRVDSFCIDSTEVTQGQYREWLDSGPAISQQPAECAWNRDFSPEKICAMGSTVCQWQTGSCDRDPQVCVDWCDARAYCAAGGKRLCGAIVSGSAPYQDPSAGQWRAACAGVYPYGNSFDPMACHPAALASIGTGPVASFPKCVALHDGQAVYDLSGNAREWEDSCSGQSGATDTCRARGGSWADLSPTQLACEALPDPPLRRDTTASDLGFRCCSP